MVKGATNLLGAAAANFELVHPSENLPRAVNSVIEAAGGARDFIPTPASMGLPSRTSLLSDAGSAVDRAQSPTLQAKKQDLAETDGFFASAGKVVTDPALLGNFAAEQVPNLALMGAGTAATGSRVAGSAFQRAVASGMSPLAARPIAQAAGQKAAERFLIGANMSLEGGSAAQQAYVDTLNLPQETWDQNADYQALIARGASPHSAKEELARTAGRKALAIAAPVAGVAGKFAAPFEAQVFTRALPRTAGHIVGGIGREGTEEAIQEGASQLASNVGVQTVDPNRGTFEGVPAAAGTGGALGVVLGGGMAGVGAATTRSGRPQRQVATPQAAPTPMLALPPPGTIDVDGEGNAATQAQQDPITREVVEDTRERESLGLTPDVNRARARHPGAIPNTRPVPQTFPNAAPGSLSDAANLIAPRPRAAAAPAEQAPASAVGGPPPLPLPQDAPRPATPPSLPWIDTATGERVEPDAAQIEAYIHDQFNLQMAAGRGVNTSVVRQALRGDGLKPSVVSQYIARVQRDRKAGLTAPAAAADVVPDGAQQTMLELDEAAAAAPQATYVPVAAPRADVMERIRSAEAITDADRAALGAQPTVDASNAARLYAEVLGAEQSVGRKAIAALPAGPDGRRDTLQVLQAARTARAPQATSEPSPLPDAAAVPPPLPDSDLAPASSPKAAASTGQSSAPAVEPPPLPTAAAGPPPLPGAPTVLPATAGEPPPLPTPATAPSPLPTSPNAQSGPVPRGEGDLPRVVVGKADGWVNVNAQAARDTADRHGITSQIEEQFAEGRTANEVTSTLDLSFLPKDERTSFVVNVRASLGIPSRADTEGQSEFDEWKASRTARRAPVASEPPPLPGGAAAPASAEKTVAAPPTPADELRRAAAEAATSPENDRPEPTEAQKDAGNYKKGHARVAGLDISIENPAGTKRRPEWPALKNHYGYFKGTIGRDKDHVDVFLTDDAGDESRPVYVVDQVDQAGKFDEHKVVLGAANEAEARATYLANYSKGWTGLGGIAEMSLDQFKVWVRDPNMTKRRVTRAPRSNVARPAAGSVIDASAEVAAGTAGRTRRNSGPKRSNSTDGKPDGLFSKAGRA
ncbi:MAG: hypothetical protein ACREP7_23365, partial [Lysobacter sp.]